MAIDIGTEAIDRVKNIGIYTLINKGNPANASGIITSVEIYAGVLGLLNCEVAIFYEGESNIFTTRSNVSLGTVEAGYSQHDVNLAVETGDYIGIYYSAGSIDRVLTGGVGFWYLEGDYIPCTDQEFTPLADNILSLYGSGEEVTEWTGKVSGVTNPAKVMGVAVANIKSVIGVE